MDLLIISIIYSANNSVRIRHVKWQAGAESLNTSKAEGALILPLILASRSQMYIYLCMDNYLQVPFLPVMKKHVYIYFTLKLYKLPISKNRLWQQFKLRLSEWESEWKGEREKEKAREIEREGGGNKMYLKHFCIVECKMLYLVVKLSYS